LFASERAYSVIKQSGESEAYALGCIARNDGKTIEANPYDQHDPTDWQAWRNGWEDTDFDTKEAEKETST